MISQQELIFANEYMQNGRDANAAFAVAYPEQANSAHIQAHAHRVLAQQNVQRYINTYMQTLQPLPENTEEAMIEITREIAMGQVNIYDRYGMPVTELGADNSPIIVSQEVKPTDRLKAAEMLLRLEGRFEKDNKQKASKELIIENMDDEKLQEMLNDLQTRRIKESSVGGNKVSYDEAQIIE